MCTKLDCVWALWGYLIYVPVHIWASRVEIGQVAPAFTALIAFAAACIALRSIAAQKVIARKRAAIDFFLKTETDSYMMTAWQQIEDARLAVKDCTDVAAFKETKHWVPLRNYLNLHEMMAVGVNQQVLDDSVCFDFWHGELHRAYRDCKKAVDYIQGSEDERWTYVELIDLHEKWDRRAREMRTGRMARRKRLRSAVQPPLVGT